MKDHRPTLHLICGLPGSGKSTLAGELEKTTQAVRLEPDAWLKRIVGRGDDENARSVVEMLQWELAQQLLGKGIDVILEFGFWSLAERSVFRQGALDLGAATKLHYLNVPVEELKARVSRRNQNLPENTFFVDPADIDIWIKSFEVPTPDELGE